VVQFRKKGGLGRKLKKMEEFGLIDCPARAVLKRAITMLFFFFNLAIWGVKSDRAGVN
jgi:hypothetical protein